MHFDAYKPFTDSEYKAFIDWLEARTVEALRSAWEQNGNASEAIRDYLETAYKAGLSISECVDFFCVSTPNIAESVGYPPQELNDVIKLFDSINASIAPQFFEF